MTGQFPFPPPNPRDYRSQQDAALRTGKAEGAAGWGRALKPETQSQGREGAVGAGAGRGNAQAPWRAAGAGPPLRGARVPLRFQQQQISASPGAATSSATPRGGAWSPVVTGEGWRAPGPSAGSTAVALALRWAPAEGPAEAAAAAVLKDGRAASARDAARRICGISWPPRRRHSPAPPERGRREGGGRKGGGKRGGQRPGWLGSDPAAARPLPPQAGPGAPGPPLRPAHPGGSHGQARPPPDTGRPARIPKGEVSIWDPQQVPGKQSRRSRSPTSAAAPPPRPPAPPPTKWVEQSEVSPREGMTGAGVENTLRPCLWHGGTQVTQCLTGRGGTRVPSPGTSRGRGGAPLQVAPRVRAWQPGSHCACAPGGPALSPSLPPPRASPSICRGAPGRRPQRVSSQCLQLTLSPPSFSFPIIHSTQYWYLLNLNKMDTIPLTLECHILRWWVLGIQEPFGTQTRTQMFKSTDWSQHPASLLTVWHGQVTYPLWPLFIRKMGLMVPTL